MVKPVTIGSPFRSVTSRRPGWRELGLLLLGFVLAVACFMGLTLYADTRLAAVAEQSHEVTDNALPSIVELGTVRRGLAQIELDLREGARGDRERMRDLPFHVSLSEEAWQRYLDLPRFQGEVELQEYARGRLDAARRVAERVQASIEVGALHEAEAWARSELQPAAEEADDALNRLIQFNHQHGTQIALEADRSWSRTRRLSIVADIVCALLTAALAWLGFRSTRHFMSMQKRRADELEAFASRVAHDVRGPLTPALFTLQMFEREFVGDDKHHKMAERGVRSLRRVDQLVGDLLTFARSAAAPDGNAHAPLGPVIAGVVQDLEAQATAARVRLEVSDIPSCEVACGPGVLTSVVMNLVSNAIKYMPRDAALRVVRIRAVVDQLHARVEVADTGAGVPEAVHERIFEPYVRVDQSQPGLGLGLATVRRLVDAHRGQVGVRSIDGDGALFWFALPLRPSGAREDERAS
ncbi:MAG TPA: ATP-binding protein [Polyangiaceae bacterium]|jgi:signal transduction histidine kinase|nr:ATP-binding protein [Polyangiaceae bacterium]